MLFFIKGTVCGYHIQQVKINPKLGTKIVSLHDKYTIATINHIFSCPQFTGILNELVISLIRIFPDKTC